MKIIKKTVLFLLVIFFNAFAFGQTPGTIKSRFIDGVSSSTFKLFYSKSNIDKGVIRYLKREKDEDLKFVNPSDSFNTTDMIIEGFPNNRLILVGKSDAGTNFIFFEHGGNARHTICLVYEKMKGRYYKVLSFRFTRHINSMEKLKKSVLSGDYTEL